MAPVNKGGQNHRPMSVNTPIKEIAVRLLIFFSRSLLIAQRVTIPLILGGPPAYPIRALVVQLVVPKVIWLFSRLCAS